MLAIYVALTTVPFVVAAVTWDQFWTSAAPVSALVVALILVALLAGHRWAWFLLAAFDASILVSYAWDPGDAIGFASTAVALAALVSPPVRRYVFDRSAELVGR